MWQLWLDNMLVHIQFWPVFDLWPLFSRTCNGRSQEVRRMKAWVLRSCCQVHHSCVRKCHSKCMSENPAKVSSTTLDPQTHSVMLFAKQGQSSYSLNARTWKKKKRHILIPKREQECTHWNLLNWIFIHVRQLVENIISPLLGSVPAEEDTLIRAKVSLQK